VYEFIHSQLTHNRTYAFRLPPTFAEQARHHVNLQQAAIFGSDEIGSIANVAGRTLLRSILNALSRVAYNGDPLQLHLTEAPYQPFISLMSMLALDQQDPTLRGLRTCCTQTTRCPLTLRSELRVRARDRAPPGRRG
jgi:lysosomal acid phosphatase